MSKKLFRYPGSGEIQIAEFEKNGEFFLIFKKICFIFFTFAFIIIHLIDHAVRVPYGGFVCFMTKFHLIVLLKRAMKF